MASEEQVAEAKSLGWAPQDAWRGDPERWVDADVYLERGWGIHHVKDQLESERQRSAQLEAKLNETSEAVKAANAAIAALEEANSATAKAAAEEAVQAVVNELAEAHKDGDHALAASLTAKLATMNQELVAAGGKKQEQSKDEEPKPRAVMAPELKAWLEANADFAQDRRRVALGNVIAGELRAEQPDLKGTAFMDEVRARTEKMLGIVRRTGSQKVESGGGGGGRGSSGSDGGKSYADLPPEAKAACDKQEARLVGPGKAHKDQASWRASYVRQYFRE